jgi:hypothetical protein
MNEIKLSGEVLKGSKKIECSRNGIKYVVFTLLFKTGNVYGVDRTHKIKVRKKYSERGFFERDIVEVEGRLNEQLSEDCANVQFYIYAQHIRVEKSHSENCENLFANADFLKERV